jgi:hypothetical protein
MDEVIRRERENSAAKGRRDYASRPAAFRGESDERIQSRHMDLDVSDLRQHKREAKPKIDDGKANDSQKPREKTAAELAAIQEKKMKLMAKYG